jgi:hypothetical protein
VLDTQAKALLGTTTPTCAVSFLCTCCNLPTCCFIASFCIQLSPLQLVLICQVLCFISLRAKPEGSKSRRLAICVLPPLVSYKPMPFVEQHKWSPCATSLAEHHKCSRAIKKRYPQFGEPQILPSLGQVLAQALIYTACMGPHSPAIEHQFILNLPS